MKAITLEDLHEKTEHWVRSVAEYGPIVVLDRDRAIASIQPVAQVTGDNPFASRQFVPAYAAVMDRLAGGTDSTEIVSDGRERTVP